VSDLGAMTFGATISIHPEGGTYAIRQRRSSMTTTTMIKIKTMVPMPIYMGTPGLNEVQTGRGLVRLATVLPEPTVSETWWSEQSNAPIASGYGLRAHTLADA
jgi:hypothetical protein